MKTLPALAAALAMLAALPAHGQTLNASETDLMDAWDGCKRIENGATEVIFIYKGFSQVPNVGLVRQSSDHAIAVNLVEKPDQNGRIEHQCISMLAPSTGSDALFDAVRADARARGFIEQPRRQGSDGASTVLPFTNAEAGALITLIVSPVKADRNFPMVTLSEVWTSK